MNRRRFVQAAAAVPLATGAVTAGAKSARPDFLGVAKAIITSWRAGDLDGMLSHVADDIVWHSHVGSPPFVGKAAMRDFATKLTSAMKDIRWRVFGAAQHDDRIYLEGVDDFVDTNGRRIVIPYLGVLVFRDMKVVEWRDYFDRGLADRLKAGEPLPDYLEALTQRPALF
jgi:ketosteroid isomerase-like protein